DASGASSSPSRDELPLWRRSPIALLALTALFGAFVLVPRVRDTPSLVTTFAGVAVFLAAWTLALWIRSKRTGRRFAIELVPPAKAHYIQSAVQLTFYAYWGWYWREVYAELPL